MGITCARERDRALPIAFAVLTSSTGHFRSYSLGIIISISTLNVNSIQCCLGDKFCLVSHYCISWKFFKSFSEVRLLEVWKVSFVKSLESVMNRKKER